MNHDSREDEYAYGASEALYDYWLDRQDQDDLDHGLPEADETLIKQWEQQP